MTGMSKTVKIGFIGGTGPEGRGLALRFAAAGIPVTIGSRDWRRAQEVACRIDAQLEPYPIAEPVSYAANDEVVSQSDFVFLTIPFHHATDILQRYRNVFRTGQVIVDVSVPLFFEGGCVHLRQLDQASGSSQLVRFVPENVGFVAAFKTIPAHALNDLKFNLDCDVFVCGRTVEARNRVIDLINLLPDARAVDVGGLGSAAALEHMCVLAVRVNREYKSKASRFKLIGIEGQ